MLVLLMANFHSQASQLRMKSEHCRRLARDTTDPAVRKALETMAQEYADAARLIDERPVDEPG